MLKRAKERASRKNIPFGISESDIQIPDICPVLGLKLKSRVYEDGGRTGYFDSSPSLDRIKPELGYVKGNIRVISNRANTLKSNATLEELELILEDARKQ